MGLKHLDQEIIELKEHFNMMKEAQIKLCPYYKELNRYREDVVKCINKYTEIFQLKIETYFKTIQLFDMYNDKLMKTTVTDNKLNWENIFIISIICLNLACKQEENNCNYLIFLKEHVLDKNEITRNMKYLIKIEIDILKKINFKVNTPGFFYFNSIFFNLAVIEIENYFNYTIKQYNFVDYNNFPEINEVLYKFTKFNEIITKNYTSYSEYIHVSPVSAGLICFKVSLLFLNFLFSNNLILSKLEEIINVKVVDVVIDLEYLEKINYEAFFLFSKLSNSIDVR